MMCCAMRPLYLLYCSLLRGAEMGRENEKFQPGLTRQNILLARSWQAHNARQGRTLTQECTCENSHPRKKWNAHALGTMRGRAPSYIMKRCVYLASGLIRFETHSHKAICFCAYQNGLWEKSLCCGFDYFIPFKPQKYSTCKRHKNLSTANAVFAKKRHTNVSIFFYFPCIYINLCLYVLAVANYLKKCQKFDACS